MKDGILEKIDCTVTLKPGRKNAFEINVISEENDNIIWSGISKGPPRKLKFPDIDDIVEQIQKETKQ